MLEIKEDKICESCDEKCDNEECDLIPRRLIDKTKQGEEDEG